jgi:hypothetical protein
MKPQPISLFFPLYYYYFRRFGAAGVATHYVLASNFDAARAVAPVEAWEYMHGGESAGEGTKEPNFSSNLKPLEP